MVEVSTNGMFKEMISDIKVYLIFFFLVLSLDEIRPSMTFHF